MPARARTPALNVNVTNHVEEQIAKFARGLTPWLVWLAGIPLASALFWVLAWRTHQRVLITVLLAVSTVVVTKVTTRKAHGTGRGKAWEKIHHGLNAFVSMAFVTLVTWAGPLAWHDGLLVSYFALGLTGCLVWNVRYTSHQDGGGLEDVLTARPMGTAKKVDGAYVVRVAAGRVPAIRSGAEKLGKIVPAVVSPWREAPKGIEAAGTVKAITAGTATAGDHVDAAGAAAAAGMWSAIQRNFRDLAAHKVPDLNGARLRLLHARPWRIRTEVILVRGVHTPKVITDHRELIASQNALPLSSVIVKANPRRHDRVFMDFVLEDVLAAVRHWPGPSAIGRSIADAPVRFGVYEDRVYAESWETAITDEMARRLGVPEQNLSHPISEGMTGAGKSTCVRIVIADGATRLDVVDWAIDTVKKYQTLGCVAGALDWFATAKPEARAMVRWLADVLIPARANYLGIHGYDNWEPGCGLPFLRLTVEEGNIIASELDRLEDVLNSARSAGVKIRAAFQRAHHAVVDTNVRAAFGESLSFGVKTSDDTFVLDDELREAGADPSLWQDKQPGMLYRSAAGLPFERRMMPIRSFKVDQAACREVVSAHVAAREEWITANCPDWFALLAECDTRGIYAGRTTGKAVLAEIETAERRKAARASGQPVPVAEPHGPGRMADEDEIVEAEIVDDRAAAPVIVPDYPPDDDSDLEVTMDDLGLDPEMVSGVNEDAGIDPRQPIPDDGIPDVHFGRPPVNETPREQALALVRSHLMAMGEGAEFAPRDLYGELCPKLGRTPGWLRNVLLTISDEGLLEHDRDEGTYRVMGPRLKVAG